MPVPAKYIATVRLSQMLLRERSQGLEIQQKVFPPPHAPVRKPPSPPMSIFSHWFLPLQRSFP